MEQLKLDFNSRNARDEVRIGPAALERHRGLLGDRSTLPGPRLLPGNRVLVVDADGNQCSGILRVDPSRPDGHQYSVVMDWQTWVDGEEAGATHLAEAG